MLIRKKKTQGLEKWNNRERHFLHKHEDLSSVPKMHITMAGIVKHIGNPSDKEAESGGSQRLTGQPVPVRDTV